MRLVGARLGLVEAHVPRDPDDARESVEVFERAVDDLAVGRRESSRPCDPAVTRATVQGLFADAARARGDVAPNHRSPPATANALLRYFERHRGDARRAVAAWTGRLPGLLYGAADRVGGDGADHGAAVRASIRRASRSPGHARTSWRNSPPRFAAQHLDAMIYPTMPFPAPRAVDSWPDIRTTLGYGNWLGIPEVSVPGGLGEDGMPAGNLSFVGLPGSDARLLALAHSYQRRLEPVRGATGPGQSVRRNSPTIPRMSSPLRQSVADRFARRDNVRRKEPPITPISPILCPIIRPVRPGNRCNRLAVCRSGAISRVWLISAHATRRDNVGRKEPPITPIAPIRCPIIRPVRPGDRCNRLAVYRSGAISRVWLISAHAGTTSGGRNHRLRRLRRFAVPSSDGPFGRSLQPVGGLSVGRDLQSVADLGTRRDNVGRKEPPITQIAPIRCPIIRPVRPSNRSNR